MFEPRAEQDLLNRDDLRFLGGTEKHDLWLRVRIMTKFEVKAYPKNHRTHPLRIQNINGEGLATWDSFRLPLRKNTELDQSLPPLDRRYTGYWNDVFLTHEDIEMIETYLTCFAPWVMEIESEDEDA